MKCPRCNVEMDVADTFCGHCGAQRMVVSVTGRSSPLTHPFINWVIWINILLAAYLLTFAAPIPFFRYFYSEQYRLEELSDRAEDVRRKNPYDPSVTLAVEATDRNIRQSLKEELVYFSSLGLLLLIGGIGLLKRKRFAWILVIALGCLSVAFAFIPLMDIIHPHPDAVGPKWHKWARLTSLVSFALLNFVALLGRRGRAAFRLSPDQKSTVVEAKATGQKKGVMVLEREKNVPAIIEMLQSDSGEPPKFVASIDSHDKKTDIGKAVRPRAKIEGTSFLFIAGWFNIALSICWCLMCIVMIDANNTSGASQSSEEILISFLIGGLMFIGGAGLLQRWRFIWIYVTALVVLAGFFSNVYYFRFGFDLTRPSRPDGRPEFSSLIAILTAFAFFNPIVLLLARHRKEPFSKVSQNLDREGNPLD